MKQHITNKPNKMKNETTSIQTLKATITTSNGSNFDYEFKVYPDQSYQSALIESNRKSSVVMKYVGTTNIQYSIVA